MIKVNVIKNGVITNSANFETQTLADAWVNAQVVLKSFGKPERWIDAEDLSQMGEDRASAISSQEIGGPEDARTQYKFAAEYTISQVDITLEIQAQDQNVKSLAYLVSTDWLVIRAIENSLKPVPAEVMALRAEARSKIVKI